ncbi:MAG TPA: glycosyltransferase [Candidatus Acidoferrales bacterium]|jgi:ceramide glucosyltransferase|nr:glycosyltransferase [Candidatus Acidoferrales bacterium]
MEGKSILALVYIVLGIAAIPFIYYLLALYSTVRFFSAARQDASTNDDFLPPVSCLKPIKGLDEDAYENYASFCRQDYPEYEIVFCVDPGDPALPVLEKLIRDFPDRQIRLLFGSGRNAINDKVGRLVRLTTEAKYDMFVITDGDVRVRPDYLRTVVSPFRDPKVGAATCLYVSTKETNLVQELQSIGMISDFFAPVMVAWQLDDLKVTFGQSIITTRQAVASYGGYPVIEDRPADDVYAGRLVAEQGYEVKLLPYIVQSVADFNTMSDLLHKRTRWMTVQRLMRPWGHLGLIFTFGLPWALLAVAIHPTAAVALAYLGGYALFRLLITWTIGVWGMKQRGLWKKMPLIPLWDAMAFGMWLASFGRRTIRWRGVDYFLREGRLVAASRAPSAGGA